MSKSIDLSIVIPLFNEQEVIPFLIKELNRTGSALGKNYEVILVDDGSTDDTLCEAQKMGLVVLRHEINRGQGAALETGHEYTRKIDADYVLHFDGDGQFDPSDIAPALKALQESGADILFGSRFLGKQANLPFFKKIFILPISKLLNYLITESWKNNRKKKTVLKLLIF